MIKMHVQINKKKMRFINYKTSMFQITIIKTNFTDSENKKKQRQELCYSPEGHSIQDESAGRQEFKDEVWNVWSSNGIFLDLLYVL